MELRQLRYFVAVAEELHFGRAAERVFVTQQSLSEQIQKLEERLGIQLIQRSTRRVELTEAGQAFLPDARRLVEDAERVFRKARMRAKGELGRLEVAFVGPAFYAFLADAVRLYREEFPEVEVALTEICTDEQIEGLCKGQFQVGLLHLDEAEAGLEVEVLQRDPVMVVLPQNHPLARRSAIHPRDLKEEGIVTFPRSHSPESRALLEQVCRGYGFEPLIVQEAITMQTCINLVASGMGISMASASMAKQGIGGVVFRPIEGLEINITLAMAWAKHPSPLLRGFLRVVREAARPRPHPIAALGHL